MKKTHFIILLLTFLCFYVLFQTIPLNRILQMISHLSSTGLIQLWSSSSFSASTSGATGTSSSNRSQAVILSSMNDISQQISPETMITTTHTQYEIQSSYKIEKDELFAWKTKNPLPVLKMSEKSRRAVLEAHIPLQISHK
jgi:hypothetical protein